MEIISNGSKFAGQAPDTLDVLLARLKTEPLDPRFERFDGGFFCTDENKQLMAHGNFLTYSHVFDIRGSFQEMKELVAAITENQESPAYQQAKDQILREEAKEEARRESSRYAANR